MIDTAHTLRYTPTNDLLALRPTIQGVLAVSEAAVILKDWANVAQSASIIFASLVAIYSIDAWRREFVGKRRMELAEEILALFYQAKDIIEMIRNPVGFGGEGQSRKPAPRERPEDKAALDQAFVLIERYNQHLDLFARIHALRYRFMAQFGFDAAKPFDDLNLLINELLLAARRMARFSTGPERVFRSDAELEKHQAQADELDRIYYSGGSDDPIRPRVDQLVGEMERTCRGVIESRGTLFTVINRRLWGKQG